MRFIEAAEIRRMFNNGNYWQRAEAGELQMDLRRDPHCNPPPSTMPRCTHSQLYYYYDQQQRRVAVVHQYRLPDGTLGASGRPDPKELYVDGVLYRPHPYPSDPAA